MYRIKCIRRHRKKIKPERNCLGEGFEYKVMILHAAINVRAHMCIHRRHLHCVCVRLYLRSYSIFSANSHLYKKYVQWTVHGLLYLLYGSNECIQHDTSVLCIYFFLSFPLAHLYAIKCVSDSEYVYAAECICFLVKRFSLTFFFLFTFYVFLYLACACTRALICQAKQYLKILKDVCIIEKLKH